jgi:hypothetical protein
MTELKQFVVYKLSVGEMVYIGSTYDLRKRVREHKSDCFNSNSNKYNKPLYKYIRDNHIDFDEVKIEVLEEVQNIFLTDRANEIQARKREQYYINNQNEITGGNILNDIRAYVTEEERKEEEKVYYQNNKERIAQYYQQNKERLSQKIDCPCGGKYRYDSKTKHFKSKIHLAYLSKIKK